MYQVDLDEALGGWKRNFLGAGLLKVVDVAAVANVGGASDGIVAEKGKLAKAWSRRLMGKRGIRAQQEAHPAVSHEKIACCIVLGGTLYAHAARAVVGESFVEPVPLAGWKSRW